MNLAYYAADTLGATLYQVEGGLKGADTHQVKLGALSVNLPMDIESDIIMADLMGLWVTINKSLTLYLLLGEKKSQLFVLDPVNAKTLKASSMSSRDRHAALKAAATVVFKWTSESGWERESVQLGRAPRSAV